MLKETIKETRIDINAILTDEFTKNKGQFESSNLQNGKDLRLLIKKAKILGEYKELKTTIPDSSNFIIYMITILFLLKLL